MNYHKKNAFLDAFGSVIVVFTDPSVELFVELFGQEELIIASVLNHLLQNSIVMHESSGNLCRWQILPNFFYTLPNVIS